MTRRITLWSISLTLVAGLAFVPACEKQAKGETAATAQQVEPAAKQEAGAAAPTATAPAGPTYAVATPKSEARAGAAGKSKITVTPAKGYKWNKDYPAKLTLDAPKRVKLAKAEYKQLAGDFSTGDKDAGVEVAYTAAAEACEDTITGKLKFSVCNDKTCLIEEAAVRIAVSVTP